MMEDHEFCDDCPGCRPALLDLQTQQSLPDDDPIMVKVNRVWDSDTTYAQRRAFIKVTLHNSRNKQDMVRAQEVTQKIEVACKGVG